LFAGGQQFQPFETPGKSDIEFIIEFQSGWRRTL
jgi:hypothetical protein